AVAILGQTPRPRFEVASIKLAPGPGFSTMRPLPGRLAATAPVRVLMEAAYHVQSFQVVGGPEWVGSEKFEIDAKAAGNPERTQLFWSRHCVLEVRFRLRFPHGPRQGSVLALAPPRGAPKRPPRGEGGGAERAEPLPPLPEPGSRIAPPSQSAAPAPL